MGSRPRAPFQFRDGYEEARFGSQDVTIKTRDGAKTLHVSLAKLRVAQTAKPAEFSIGTDNDTVQLDLILIEERAR